MYCENPRPNLPRFDHDRVLLWCNTLNETCFVLHVELRKNRTSSKLSKICGHKRVIPHQFKIWTRAESPSLMTPRSRRNNHISSACGIVSIFIESSFLSLPENLSDPTGRHEPSPFSESTSTFFQIATSCYFTSANTNDPTSA